MNIEVNASGPLVSKYAEKLIGVAIRDTFTPMGHRLVEVLKAEAPVDRGNFRNSIKSKVTGTGFNTKLTIYANSKDAQWAEEGRKPGKQPPPEVMLALVKRKGLGVSALSVRTRRPIAAGTRRTRSRATGKLRTSSQSLAAQQRSIAYLIGRKIGREGTEGSHIFRDLKVNHADIIAPMITGMQNRIAAILNG